ncbi:MAG: hypothetical protein LC640_09120 [Frankia sp.]|nr:hypothetical protein [Frankia sp.]
MTWFEGGIGGPSHSAKLFDGFCVGFDYSAGVFTDNLMRAISGERAKLIGLLFGAGANTPAQRQTAAIQALLADGVINVSGAVG